MGISAPYVRAPLMNEVVDALLNRRSCREFIARPIPRDALETIVTCGQYAATARGVQPWHFTVVQGQALVDEIDEATKLGMRETGELGLLKSASKPGFHTFFHAPTVVIVSSDGSTYSEIDCANAVQNMCVAAHSLDIGSCYNWFLRWAFRSSSAAGLRERLQIPQGYTPTLSIALGYPAGPVQGNPRRTEGKITFVE